MNNEVMDDLRAVLILGVLRTKQPTHGYDIRKESEIWGAEGGRTSPTAHLNAHVTEAKVRSDLRSVTRAIGQLMYYGAAFGFGRVGLWFACPDEIDRYSLHVLERLRIRLFKDPQQLEPWAMREVEAAYKMQRADLQCFMQHLLGATSGRGLPFRARTPSSIKREELGPSRRAERRMTPKGLASIYAPDGA